MQLSCIFMPACNNWFWYHDGPFPFMLHHGILVFEVNFLPVSPLASPPSVGRVLSNTSTPVSPQSTFGSDMSGSTLPAYTSDDNVSISSASGQGNSKQFVISESWPPTIMQCIKLKSDDERKRDLVPSVRIEIVRVLANMFCHDPNPKEFCTKVAKLLVKTYNFMRDVGEHVSGYVRFWGGGGIFACFTSVIL